MITLKSLFYYILGIILQYYLKMSSDQQNQFFQHGDEQHKLDLSQRSAYAPSDQSIEQRCLKHCKKLIPPKKIQKRFWKQRDNRQYLDFLQRHEAEFSMTLSERTTSKLNVRMSSHIKYKNPQQCRSHHQKMILKCKDIRGIIAFLRRSLDKTAPGEQLQPNNDQLLEQAILEDYRLCQEEWGYFPQRNRPQDEDGSYE